MSVLRKINPHVQRAVANAALPMKAIRTRSRRWWQEGEDGFDTLLELELEETVRQAGGKAAEELIVDGEVMFYAIMRGALQVRTFSVFPLISFYNHGCVCVFPFTQYIGVCTTVHIYRKQCSRPCPRRLQSERSLAKL
jgi:hypothetical protein